MANMGGRNKQDVLHNPSLLIIINNNNNYYYSSSSSYYYYYYYYYYYCDILLPLLLLFLLLQEGTENEKPQGEKLKRNKIAKKPKVSDEMKKMEMIKDDEK